MNSTPAPTARPVLHPLTELSRYLTSWLFDLRRKRDHAAVLEVETLQDIAAEAKADCTQRCAKAFKARVLDDEGLAIVDRITSPASPGGALIVQAELGELRRARRLFARSRDIDHDLSDLPA